MKENIGRIDSIVIDYENGILLINGRKIESPLKVKVKEPDGWDICKLFNPTKAKREMICPEIIIDARDFFSDLHRQEMKELIRAVIEEAFPAKLAD